MAIDWKARIGAYLNLQAETLADATVLARLTALGVYVQSVIEQLTGRKLETGSFDELYDGDGREWLFLEQDPIVSVTGVTMDGAAVTVSMTPTSPPARCIVDRHRHALRFTTGEVFTEGVANVRVQYTAGLQAPEGLVLAGVELGAELWKDGTWSAAQRVGAGQGTSARAPQNEIPERILGLITSYRRAFK